MTHVFKHFSCLPKFTCELIDGVLDNIEEIDDVISRNLKGWSIERISKVSLCVMRIAVFEILKCDSIPDSVSINEAVELAKTYSTDKDANYINGVLGVIVKAK